MKKVYEGLFKELVKSYYDGNFNSTLENIMNSPNFDKVEAMSIISSLCGVEVKADENFIYNLKKLLQTIKLEKK